MGKTKPAGRAGNGRPLIEWVFGGVSAAVVAALILFLGYQALFGDARPADLMVTIERIDRLESGAEVVVALENRGDRAASAVAVYASERGDGASRQRIEFDYVAAHGVRRGAFIFPEPVEAADLLVEVGGYTEP